MTLDHSFNLAPFSHIQYDWYQSPLLISNPRVMNERLSEEARQINQNTFWIMNDNEEIRLEVKESPQHVSESSTETQMKSNNQVNEYIDQKDTSNVVIERKKEFFNQSNEKSNWKFQYEKNHNCLNIYDDSDTLIQKFIHEAQIFENLHGFERKPIFDIDISAHGELGVSSSTDGSVRIWNTKSGLSMRDLSSQKESKIPKGHVGDVYVSRFLPSGEVVMTGGADRRILIWRISDSLCAATLSGHEGGITSFSFIERGRNFVSSSRDGTVRLWDCATQSCITELVRAQSGNSSPIPVNECCVQKNSSLSLGDIDAKNPKDFGTESYVGVCSIEDGRCLIFDVRHRSIISTIKHESPLTSCTFIDNYLTVGQKNGHILQYDVRNISNYLSKYTSNSSPILNIKAGWKNKPNHIWFSCQDGTIRSLDFSNSLPVVCLSGFDYDPVYGLSFHSNVIYCGGRDGKIRKYMI